MNAKLRFLTILSMVMLASACGKDDTPTAAPEASLPPQALLEPDSQKVPPIIAFDINTVPVTNKDIGEFPFILPPKGYRYVTDTLTTVDESISLRDPFLHYYAVGSDRLYTVKGKVLKVWLYNEKLKNTSEPDSLFVHRHYEETITAVGGAKVYDGEVKVDGISKTTTKNNLQKTYIIRKTDTEIWFEIDCFISGCVFTVTEKEKT